MKIKKYKNDILLFFFVLLLAGCAGCFQLAFRHHGGNVRITVDGKDVTVLPLDKNDEYMLSGEVFDFEGADKEFTNTVIVKDGRVCVIDANCPDKVCQRQGWIEYSGESIVCLPHRLVVTIMGTSDEVDAVG